MNAASGAARLAEVLLGVETLLLFVLGLRSSDAGSGAGPDVRLLG